MRVLAITNLYPNPYQPHRAPFNRHQLRLLGERHPVRVIAPILWTEKRAARRAGHGPLPEGNRVTQDGLVVDHPTYWYTPKILRGQYGRFYLWSVQRAFAAAAADFRPDLVFASWAYPDAWAAARLALRNRLPLVVKLHGSDIRLLESFPRRAAGTKNALRSADGIIAVSRDLAGRAIRLGADPARVRVIVNSVDRATFCPGDRAAAQAKLGFRPGVRHLLSVGNLTAVKGPDVLLEACVQLSSRIGPWELHLVGSGPMHDELSRQVGRLGLSDRVRFHGSVPHESLPDWYRAADLFVLASRSEGTPNVLLEAAACGCPFVATEVGGVPDVAHLGAGRLVPPEQPALLADRIVEVLRHSLSTPAEGPRDWTEAADELADFLETVWSRSATGVRTNRAHVDGPLPERSPAA